MKRSSSGSIYKNIFLNVQRVAFCDQMGMYVLYSYRMTPLKFSCTMFLCCFRESSCFQHLFFCLFLEAWLLFLGPDSSVTADRQSGACVSRRRRAQLLISRNRAGPSSVPPNHRVTTTATPSAPMSRRISARRAPAAVSPSSSLSWKQTPLSASLNR